MTDKPAKTAGVLPSQALNRMIQEEQIFTSGAPPIDREEQVQPASMDLRLGSRAYRLQSSFLPQSGTVESKMKDLVMYELNLENGAILERGAVYLIPLMEKLALPEDVRGKTNPKSSTGRLDVFTRVITDYSTRFEEIAQGYHGRLYLEVVPRSFTIKVKAGQRLNQLRLFTGAFPSSGEGNRERKIGINDAELSGFYKDEELLIDHQGRFIAKPSSRLTDDGLLMGVDLASPDDKAPIGYKAKKNSHVIDLEQVGHYCAEEFWEPIFSHRATRLILEPEEFYIFASKELIRVPLSCAAEMVEFDAGSGELRTHYAGFFDPGFGYGKQGEVKGTKAVLEVRPHDVPFIIEDGQILFKMKYERMSHNPDIWYGAEIGSNYHNQVLRLAKQFKQIGS
ncbi:MAG: 2'-deoxycytidine 5'-triphosphate deaminase [Nitrospinota bacterium]|nr:2'-deoxycytidine 5'-triphosphate deaminase [Nitrospinota bacterium]